jgi:outer membrane immunogenic protein
MKMKFIAILAGVSSLVAAGTASAADMAVKARPVVAAPVYDWSGIYIGGSVGWEQDHFNWAFAPPVPAGVNQFYGLTASGGNAGVHGGIQKQWGQFVLGAEVGWIGAWDRTATVAGYGINPALNSEARIRDGIFEAGARAGLAANNWLFYGTGGYAGADIDTRGVVIATGASFAPSTAWHNGWYAGAGVEYAFANNFIVGAEYQHVWLDTARHCTGTFPATSAGCLGAAGGFNDRDIRADVDMVRVRLSYKFNPWPAAVVAKY